MHRELLAKEEARVRRLEGQVEEEKAGLECERARLWEEREAWRRHREDDEREHKARVRRPQGARPADGVKTADNSMSAHCVCVSVACVG